MSHQGHDSKLIDDQHVQIVTLSRRIRDLERQLAERGDRITQLITDADKRERELLGVESGPWRCPNGARDADAPLTLERRSELRGICDAATAGPWTECCANQPESHPCRLIWSHPLDAMVFAASLEDGDRVRKADIKFAAVARSAMPQLLAEVDRLVARVWDLESKLAGGI